MRRRRRANVGRGLFLLLVLVVLVTGYAAQSRMVPVLLAYASKQAEILGIEALTGAVRSQIAEKVNYEDLVKIEQDGEGRVTFMQLNTVAVSTILADVESAVLESLRSLTSAGFDIPLGVVSGSDIFAAYGPTIKARLVIIGAPDITIDHAFHSVGINQTRHAVNLNIKAKIRVLIPLSGEETTVSANLPLVETVIVGPVPDHYLNLDWLLRPLGPNLAPAVPGSAPR